VSRRVEQSLGRLDGRRRVIGPQRQSVTQPIARPASARRRHGR
jgi:hypothetical protein